MPPLSPREVLTLLHRTLVARSADELADLHAVDARYEFPLLVPGVSQCYHGREEIRAGFRAAWAARKVRVDELRNVVVHVTTDPEVVISEQEVAATATETGRSFVVPFLLVVRVRDGLIVHVRDYADALRAAVALDRVPALLASLDRT